jgi:hypothetical protein
MKSGQTIFTHKVTDKRYTNQPLSHFHETQQLPLIRYISPGPSPTATTAVPPRGSATASATLPATQRSANMTAATAPTPRFSRLRRAREAARTRVTATSTAIPPSTALLVAPTPGSAINIAIDPVG